MESPLKFRGGLSICSPTSRCRCYPRSLATALVYARLGLQYASLSLSQRAANYGFRVIRTYEGVAAPEHAKKSDDGVWHLKVGETVKVKLLMTTTTVRYHVALVDYLPGGLEALNPALLGTPTEPPRRDTTRNPNSSRCTGSITRIYAMNERKCLRRYYGKEVTA